MLRREELAVLGTVLGVVMVAMGIWGASTSQATNTMTVALGAGMAVIGTAWWQVLRRR